MIFTIENIEYAYNNCTNVNESTKRIYMCYINKIKQWGNLEFETAEDLIKIFTDHHMSNNQIYSILGLLRCTCVVNNVDNNVKDIVYTLYHDYNKISKDDQYSHRLSTRWTTDSLIKFNKSLQIDSYRTMTAKLLIGMYTLIPPLRNDYNNVHIIDTNNVSINDSNDSDNNDDSNDSSINSNDSNNSSITMPFNYYNMLTKELNVYCTKSKKYHSVTVPDELANIIAETLIFMPRKYLFTTQHGKPFSNSSNMYSQIMKHLRAVINEDSFTINTFRHLYASKSFAGTVQDRIAAQKGMLHNAENHLRYGK